MKKLEKNRHMRDQLHLLAAILATWWHPVDSSEALDFLYWAMQAVLYRCTATAIKMAATWVYFFVVVWFFVALGAIGAIQSK
jgi:hypothetical protein